MKKLAQNKGYSTEIDETVPSPTPAPVAPTIDNDAPIDDDVAPELPTDAPVVPSATPALVAPTIDDDAPDDDVAPELPTEAPAVPSPTSALVAPTIDDDAPNDDDVAPARCGLRTFKISKVICIVFSPLTRLVSQL